MLAVGHRALKPNNNNILIWHCGVKVLYGSMPLPTPNHSSKTCDGAEAQFLRNVVKKLAQEGI